MIEKFLTPYKAKTNNNIIRIRDGENQQQGKAGVESEFIVVLPKMPTASAAAEELAAFVTSNNTVLEVFAAAHNSVMAELVNEERALAQQMEVPFLLEVSPIQEDASLLTEYARRYRAVADAMEKDTACPNPDHIPIMRQGAELLEKMTAGEIQRVTTNKDTWHPDNPLLIENVSPPCSTAAEIDLHASLQQRILEKAAMELAKQDIKIHPHASTTVYNDEGALSLPALLAFIPMLAVRHASGAQRRQETSEKTDINSLNVETIAAFWAASMFNAGTHYTGGSKNVDDLGRRYRVMAAFLPVMAALSANSPEAPNGTPVHSARILQGGFLGVHPEQGQPRMGLIPELLEADLTAEEFSKRYLDRILNATAIVDCAVHEGKYRLLPVATGEGWPKTTRQVLEALVTSPSFEQLDPETQQTVFDQALESQFKVWGPGRLRLELLHKEPVALFEERGMDLVPPSQMAMLHHLQLKMTDSDLLRAMETFAQDHLGLPRAGASAEETKIFMQGTRETTINVADQQGTYAAYASGMTVGQVIGWLSHQTQLDLKPVRESPYERALNSVLMASTARAS